MKCEYLQPSSDTYWTCRYVSVVNPLRTNNSMIIRFNLIDIRQLLNWSSRLPMHSLKMKQPNFADLTATSMNQFNVLRGETFIRVNCMIFTFDICVNFNDRSLPKVKLAMAWYLETYDFDNEIITKYPRWLMMGTWVTLSQNPDYSCIFTILL